MKKFWPREAIDWLFFLFFSTIVLCMWLGIGCALVYAVRFGFT